MTSTCRRKRETVTCLGLVLLLWQARTEAGALHIANEQLRVSLVLPSGLLTVRDIASGAVWRQYVPFRSAHGREWGKVETSADRRHR